MSAFVGTRDVGRYDPRFSTGRPPPGRSDPAATGRRRSGPAGGSPPLGDEIITTGSAGMLMEACDVTAPNSLNTGALVSFGASWRGGGGGPPNLRPPIIV